LAPKKISAKEVLAYISAGMSNDEIGKKYGLSAKGTQILFDKLLSANLLSSEEHSRRIVSSTQPADLADDNGGRTVVKQEITQLSGTSYGNTPILERRFESDDKGPYGGSRGTAPVEPALQESTRTCQTQKDSVPVSIKFIDVSKQGRNQWWRYLVGILFILVFSISMSAIVGGVWESNAHFDTTAGRFVGIDSFSNYIQLNLGIVFLLVSLFLVVRFEHKRPFLSLITPNQSINWKKVGKSFGLFTGLLAFAAIVDYILNPSDFQYSLNPARFLLWLPVVLILTPIQTATEELLFRGYLLQMMALLTTNRAVLVLTSGVLFMLPHLANPEVAAGFLPMSLYYLAVGCFLTIVTLKSNSLEVAIGIHTAVNLFASLIVNYANSSLTTESIFFSTDLNPVGSLLSFGVQAVVFYLLMFGGRTTLQRILHYRGRHSMIGSSLSSRQ